MILNPDQLKEVEDLASLFLEPDEIAVLIDVDMQEFEKEISTRKGEIFISYFKGKTLSKKEVHENIVKLAKRGSPQAEELVTSFIMKQNMAENRAKRKG